MSQTEFTVSVGESAPLTLSRAVLIYEDQRHQAFATVHKCELVNGKPVLMAGRAMTPSMSLSLAGKLTKRRILGEYLPENVLMTDGDTLMWYEKPQMRHLAFKDSTEVPSRSLGVRGGMVPTPGVIFVAGPRLWSVFTFKGNERPAPEAPIFAAPFYNVYADGSICQGNVITPKSTAPDRISTWNDAFFRSFFVHANYEGVVNYEGDVTALWTHLLDGKFGDRFPEEVLKPYGVAPYKLNLSDLIRKGGQL